MLGKNYYHRLLRINYALSTHREARIEVLTLLFWKSKKFLLLMGLWLLAVGTWHSLKPLPDGLSAACSDHRIPISDAAFFRDNRYADATGNLVSDQEIADAVLAQIRAAREWIVVDMFLFNDWKAQGNAALRPLSSELVSALIAQKQRYPNMEIVFITDPLNTLYGSFEPAAFQQLETAGIEVVITQLTALRDSNPLWSSIWRTGIQWFGNDANGGWIGNPFTDQHPMTIRGWLAVPNFKANHRKVLLSDAPGKPYGQALITSANPHDASSLHSNVALQVAGKLVPELLSNELAIMKFSTTAETQARIESLITTLSTLPDVPDSSTANADNVPSLLVGCATEGKILNTALDWVNQAQLGDEIQIAQFYFSHQGLKTALIDAANRGVGIQLILDSNKDAFGMEKDGTPNRPMAHELVTAETDMPIKVRWYDTHGEQFHSKLLMWTDRDTGKMSVTLGSGNFTRRNIGDYNLEANLTAVIPQDQPLAQSLRGYFAELWDNPNGKHYTVDYPAYADDSRYRYWKMRAMEATGLSSF